MAIDSIDLWIVFYLILRVVRAGGHHLGSPVAPFMIAMSWRISQRLSVGEVRCVSLLRAGRAWKHNGAKFNLLSKNVDEVQ